MNTITEKIEKTLFENADEEYKLFQLKLMPGIAPERVIGVRTPVLRALAKKLCKEDGIEDFLSEIPHKYYDENNLHGFIISECKDYAKSVKYVDALLPYVDNWATCDLLSPKAFKKNHDALALDAKRWMASGQTYTVRFGIEMVMSHFLDDDFRQEFFDIIADIRSHEYYINMMIAWFFATALTKKRDAAMPYIEGRRLDEWVHNKTIQKACESYRISDEDKNYLRLLKIK